MVGVEPSSCEYIMEIVTDLVYVPIYSLVVFDARTPTCRPLADHAKARGPLYAEIPAPAGP